MGRRLSLYRVMDALPHLQRLDLHNMTRDNRRRAFFNAALLRPDLRGFPLQVLRIHIRDLTATLMDSIQLELRQLQSITIHGSSTLHQFARETGRIVRDHERALAKHRINPDQNLLTECTVLNTSLASLTFEDNLHVNLYLQHVHRIFSRVTRLRLHNCGMRGGGSLNAGAWNLQSFELDITNIRPPPQTIQVNTGTNARGFRLHNGRYIAIGPNEAFVPDLRLSALSLQQFVIYSAGLNQIFIIDHP
ncbi:uncharacterized protein ATC70_008739 [Mucor velutinosus]|uniref:Uncharacterized protein n=1 Tax=Mucor velutinosus TaxID=708070 RepID=A0AAN7DJE2_9FUNG|nr:hypothetical protein ATC70_008739 [Mucor velutinosus]